MVDFDIGDRIYHVEYGLGTVGWLGPDNIGVDFDQCGKALLKRDAADMRSATATDEQSLPDTTADETLTASAAQQETFFVCETGEGVHSMGSHWQPFFDDAKSVMLRLPGILATVDLHRGYARFFPPPEQLGLNGFRGALLVASSEAIAGTMGFENKPHPWDSQTSWRSPGGALEETPERAQSASARNTGVAVVLRLATSADEANLVSSLFPYCFDGIEQTVTLTQVHVWESGLEAQIEGTLGNAVIAFYDIDFVNNRNWYQRDHNYQFVLIGLAYQASPAKAHSFTIPRTQAYLDGMTWLSGKNRSQDDGTLTEAFNTEGMSMLLPVDDWDIDDYAFHGRIKDIWGMSMLGLRAWRVRVTVVRDAPDDIDLDIVITERAWDGDAVPKAGQSIEGRIWLQGRLWRVDN